MSRSGAFVTPGPGDAGGSSAASWAGVEATVPGGWSRAERLPDDVDTRLDALLDRVDGPAREGSSGPGDLREDQQREARMLQVYAERAASRAVRDGDPSLVRRAALALVVAVPAADHRDQVRRIAVVADAADRVGTSLEAVVARLRPAWDELHLRRLVEFSDRSAADRQPSVMEFDAEGGGARFRYRDRMSADPAASARELADLMEAGGFPADVVARLRADADRAG